MQVLQTPAQAVQWLRGRVVGTLHTDSRQVGTGDAFIAWPGAAADGRAHVAAALAQGAAACLVEQDGVDAFAFDSDAVACYPRLKAATAPIAAAWFNEPSQQLDVLAVTGTNGKTSVTWWLAQALSNMEQPAQIRCGLVGTLGMGSAAVAGAVAVLRETGMTTPDPVLLQRQFRAFADEGYGACAVEASSIGLAEHRLDATRVRVAVLTNVTQDHLDYHGSMDAYWAAKAALFAWPGLQAAVVNIDDPRGAELARALADQPRSHELALWTVSTRGAARLIARDVRRGGGGLACVVEEGDERHALQTRLVGDYNLSNLLCVLATLRALGVPLAAGIDACRRLQPVPGRMECTIVPGQPLVAVDYAHTPDALEKALGALRPLAEERGGRLWCVFGCGGNRDAGKRPLMGAAAIAGADRVVVTNDNPRDERPDRIADAIVEGMLGARDLEERLDVEPDRARAIAQAIAAADPHDVVLVAGKGHETTQEEAGRKTSFSDGAQVRSALAARGARPGVDAA